MKKNIDDSLHCWTDIGDLPVGKKHGVTANQYEISRLGDVRVLNYGKCKVPPQFVYFHKVSKLWIGQVRLNGKDCYIGSCQDNEKEKEKLRNKCIKLYNKDKKIKIIKCGIDNQGYQLVSLCGKKGKKHTTRTARIHILVAQAFIPNANNYPQVDHKDGNKTNNHVDNLRWATSRQQALNKSKDSREGSTSKYKGVQFLKKVKGSRKWRARCQRASGTTRSLGYSKTFNTEIEAGKARDQYIRDNFSKEDQAFVKFNFPE
mgnify:CR=1 FL=1|tara:strand:+ start:834 stop:1613 length:780 start_codon:yes stop_codon:yes gene_type:complete